MYLFVSIQVHMLYIFIVWFPILITRLIPQSDLVTKDW